VPVLSLSLHVLFLHSLPPLLPYCSLLSLPEWHRPQGCAFRIWKGSFVLSVELFI
jgi:hypothetical protein